MLFYFLVMEKIFIYLGQDLWKNTLRSCSFDLGFEAIMLEICVELHFFMTTFSIIKAPELCYQINYSFFLITQFTYFFIRSLL